MFAGGTGCPSFSDCPGRGNETREDKKRKKKKRRRGCQPNDGAITDGEPPATRIIAGCEVRASLRKGYI